MGCSLHAARCGLSVAESKLIDRCDTLVQFLNNWALLLPRLSPFAGDHRELAAYNTLAITFLRDGRASGRDSSFQSLA